MSYFFDFLYNNQNKGLISSNHTNEEIYRDNNQSSQSCYQEKNDFNLNKNIEDEIQTESNQTRDEIFENLSFWMFFYI